MCRNLGISLIYYLGAMAIHMAVLRQRNELISNDREHFDHVTERDMQNVQGDPKKM